MRKIKLPSSDKFHIWIGIALLVKITFLVLKISDAPHNVRYDCFGSDDGDAASYIEPIENLLLKGEYYDDYRMPGYGWLYFIFRLFANQSISLNLLIVFQVILSAVSVYVLALIGQKIFKEVKYFYITYFIYLISTFVSLFDANLLTESFCTSGMIFALFFLLKGGNKNYLYSGLFITWVIFLRPVFLPLLFLFLLYVFVIHYQSGKLRSRKTVVALLSLALPFLLIDGAWISRNYAHYKRFIPLAKSVYYPGLEGSYMVPLYQFMNSFGGSIVHWEPGSEITYFKRLPGEVHVRKEGSLPENIYTTQFDQDSLKIVRDEIRMLESDSITFTNKKEVEQRVIAKLSRYTLSVKEQKPFLYYIGSRIKVFKTFFIRSGTYNLFNKASYELNKAELLIKIFYSLLYLFVVVFGLFGLILLFIKGIRDPRVMLISLMGLYSSLVFPMVLKLDESRYFVPGYPIFVIASAFVLASIYLKFKKKT